MFSTTPLQLHWNQRWILGTQYFQIPPNLAGFWQFLQCKLLPCLPTQFATACQLVAKLLATTCKNVSLVLQHASALDPQAAWTWSSLNGLQSSYKSAHLWQEGAHGPWNYLQTTLYQTRFGVYFLFAILSKHKPSHFPQTFWKHVPSSLWKSLKVQETSSIQLNQWEPLQQKEISQSSCPQVGNFPIQAFVTPMHLQ